MSNELTVAIKIAFSKSNVGEEVYSYAKAITVDGDCFVHGTQSIGTTEEEIAQLADLGTPGWVLLINQDATNYVEVGKSTGVYTVKMEAGEPALFRLDGTALLAKANTDACVVEFFIFED